MKYYRINKILFNIWDISKTYLCQHIDNVIIAARLCEWMFFVNNFNKIITKRKYFCKEKMLFEIISGIFSYTHLFYNVSIFLGFLYK